MTSPKPYLAIIGDREALVWVLENQQLAFPEPRYPKHFPTLRSGDTLFLYTTRGCFKNPTRDRGRVIGSATVSGQVQRGHQPISVRGRTLPLRVALKPRSLVDADDGIDLSEQVARMSSFPKPDKWAMYMRRSLVPLTPADARRLDTQLGACATWADNRLDTYRLKAKVRS